MGIFEVANCDLKKKGHFLQHMARPRDQRTCQSQAKSCRPPRYATKQCQEKTYPKQLNITASYAKVDGWGLLISDGIRFFVSSAMSMKSRLHLEKVADFQLAFRDITETLQRHYTDFIEIIRPIYALHTSYIRPTYFLHIR